MFTARLAEVPFAVDTRYDYTDQLFEGYKAAVPLEDCAFQVAATEQEIQAENSEDHPFCPSYCESLALYRKICLNMVDHDAFLFHAAVIAYNGSGFAFTARSGTGKSTHITQWKKALGDQVTIINGDKPLIRCKPDGVYAYGTPYNGKEGWGCPESVKLEAICFVERGEVDALERVTDEGYLINHLIPQVLMPQDPQRTVAFLGLLDRVVGTVPFYVLRCTPTTAAFEAALGMVPVV